MAGIISWIGENLGSICTLACALIFLSSIVVRLTPSVKDNEVLYRIISILDRFSVAKTADDRKCIEDAKRNLK